MFRSGPSPIVAALGLGLVLATSASADRVWVALDGAPAGTPAEIALDASRSSDQETWVDVTIHGFWRIDRRGPDDDGYHEVIVPGLESQVMAGLPDLPRAVVPLAMPGRIAAQVIDVESDPPTTFTGYQVWPQGVPDQEYPDGKPGSFALDEGVYLGVDPWPVERATVDDTSERIEMGIRGTSMVVNPLRWNPSTGVLEVSPVMSVGIAHPGPWVPFEPITRERHRMATETYANWTALGNIYPVNLVSYEAHYLIIAPTIHYPVLEPLIQRKRAKGFDVEFVATELVGGSCESVRLAILSWYFGTPSNRDHYCLLVGDVDEIPLCDTPSGALEYAGIVSTDDLYGSLDDNLTKEIFVGRLSVNDRDDTRRQVEKIIAYEDEPHVQWPYGRVGLVAHAEDAPAKYQWAHEQVRLADYAVTPTFVTLYGSAGTTDADVRDAVESGFGLVAYRGHGSSTAWTTWNAAGESFDVEDVSVLENSRTPIVWSLSCSNAKLSQDDSIAEVWMSSVFTGGVAHYGAAAPSYTLANHVLDARLFEAVYDRGLTTHAAALAWAEKKMAASDGPDNAWMYLLLGDPDMQIRREGLIQEVPWLVSTTEIGTCPGGSCFFEVVVEDLSGVPLPDVLVGAWKPLGAGITGDGDDVFANRYTDADGRAMIPASPSTEGWLYYAVEDELGNALFDSVYVASSVDVAGAASGPMSFRVAPTVMRSHARITFDAPLRASASLTVVDATGRRVRTLDAPAGSRGLTWDGRTGTGDAVAAGTYWIVLRDRTRRLVERVVVVG